MVTLRPATSGPTWKDCGALWSAGRPRGEEQEAVWTSTPLTEYCWTPGAKVIAGGVGTPLVSAMSKERPVAVPPLLAYHRARRIVVVPPAMATLTGSPLDLPSNTASPAGAVEPALSWTQSETEAVVAPLRTAFGAVR